jgi:mitogen-activated protein kinase 1/3
LGGLGDNYQIIQSLGEGAYGTVVSALHKPSGKQVAIKRILPFEHSLFCLRTLRELKLLRYFSEECDNENVRALRTPLFPVLCECRPRV